MAQDDLDEADGSVEEQVARLLHQVRTPLLTIKALSERIGPERMAASENSAEHKAITGEDIADGAAGLRADINRQVDRINAELDSFWAWLTQSPACPEPAEPAGHVQVSFNILYVDDDQIHRDIGLRLLEQLGHKIVVCADGVTALELCETQAFDIIFLDEHAPVIRGTDFARGWAGAAGAQAMPYMIGMSNDPRVASLRQACLDAGMQDFMEKPVTGVKLMQVLAKAAERLG